MLKRLTILLLTLSLCLGLGTAPSHAIQNPMKPVIQETDFVGTYALNYGEYCVIEQDGNHYLLINPAGELIFESDRWLGPDAVSGLYLVSDDAYYRLSDNSVAFTRAQMEENVKAFLEEHHTYGEVVSIQTRTMISFRDGLVSNSFNVVINEDGHETAYEIYAILNGEGLVQYIPPLMSFTSATGFAVSWYLSSCSEGRIQYAQTYTDFDGKVQTYELGYMTPDGERVLVFSHIDIPVENAILRDLEEFDYVEDFHNGTAVAYSPEGLVTMIDRSGNKLFDFRRGSIFNNITGSYPVSFDGNGKWGYIDTAGLTVLPHEYEYAAGSSGLLFTVVKDKACGIVDENGEIIVPFEYDAMSNPKGNVVYAIKGGKVSIIHFEEDTSSTNPGETDKVSSVFSDVPENAWYEKFLQNAYDNGIVGGKGNGIYDPDGQLKHGEIMVMVANLRARMKGETAGFTATAGGHWASAYRDYCKAEGIIDARFDAKLDEYVTREEMAYYFAHALETGYYRNTVTTTFGDIASSPYQADIMTLAKADIVSGKSQGVYDPSALIKRSEASVFVSNLLDAIAAGKAR